jgi:hypothetical protein
VWWSEKQAAEKFYHEVCYMSEAGYKGSSSGTKKSLSLTPSSTKSKDNEMLVNPLVRAGGSLFGWAGMRGPAAKKNMLAQRGNVRRGRNLLQGPPPPPGDDDAAPGPGPSNDDTETSTPCYNLMTGGLDEGAKAYLYTAEEDFCCVATGSPEDLAPPQSDFMDYMTLAAKETITTAFYSGDAYRYTEELADGEAVSDFWYVTDLEGYPLQQGEGGTSMTESAGKGVFIYHEYNSTTWAENVTLDEDIFKVPDICLSSTTKCGFP